MKAAAESDNREQVTGEPPHQFGGSHPVPDIPTVRSALGQARSLLAPAAAAAPTFTTDRMNYDASQSEAPVYEINNAPHDQPILWTADWNGKRVSTNQSYGYKTDGLGHWGGEGNPWQPEDAGFWRVQITVPDPSGDAFTAVQCFTVINGFPASGSTAADHLGVTHVGGNYRFAGPGSLLGNGAVSSLVEGAQQILNLGARRAFCYLTFQYKDSDYKGDDFGPGPINNLTDLAKTPPFQQLFAQPLDTIVLTVYGFASKAWILDRAQGGQNVNLDPAAETKEIADLVAYLSQTYTGKKFIIKNWEGDWQLLEEYDPNGAVAQSRVDEFVRWMQARQDGVNEGLQNGSAAADVIRHAIEVNLLDRARRDISSVLRDVAPRVPSGLISYSSWETSNAHDPRRMQDAIAYIQGSPGVGNRDVMIGEYGILNDPMDATATADLTAVANGAIAMGVSAFYWAIYNTGVASFGLVGPDFAHYPAWYALRDLLGGSQNAAKVVNHNVPAAMTPGKRVTINVTLSNPGITWYQSVGYYLGVMNADGTSPVAWAWIPFDVAKNGSVSFNADFTAPSLPGSYRFQMVQHGVEAFGDAIQFQIGSAAPAIAA